MDDPSLISDPIIILLSVGTLDKLIYRSVRVQNSYNVYLYLFIYRFFQDDIIDISKNPTKYGIINDDDDVGQYDDWLTWSTGLTYVGKTCGLRRRVFQINTTFSILI